MLKLAKLLTIEKVPEVIKNGTISNDNVKNLHGNGAIKYAYIEGNVVIDKLNFNLKLSIKKSAKTNKFWVHNVDINENISGTTSADDISVKQAAFNSTDIDYDCISDNAKSQEKYSTARDEDISDAEYFWEMLDESDREEIYRILDDMMENRSDEELNAEPSDEDKALNELKNTRELDDFKKDAGTKVANELIKEMKSVKGVWIEGLDQDEFANQILNLYKYINSIRLAGLASIVDADVYIHGHTHLPMIIKEGFFRVNSAAHCITLIEKLFVNGAANLDYGGYGEVYQYKPSAKSMPTIYLEANDGRKKTRAKL